MSDLFEKLPAQIDQLNNHISQQTRQLSDFARRLELILSQDHKQIPIRDQSFAEDFTSFCAQWRSYMDETMTTWQHLREQIRQQLAAKKYPSSLQTKSFTLRAKTLSGTCDDFTTAYDRFTNLYKNYTLSKLPVWILTACSEDLNNWTKKILFLSREMTKYTAKN